MPHSQIQIISSEVQDRSAESEIGAPCDVRERRGMCVLELGCVINGVKGQDTTERRMCKEQYFNHVLAGTECEENPGEVRRTGPKF